MQARSSATLFALVVFGGTLALGEARAEMLDGPVERYRPHMIADIGQSLAEARTLRERAAANDIDGAKKAWIAARVGWERAEVFTSGFVPDLDEQIDAWPSALTGFHAIEARLFGAESTDFDEESNRLVYHLADLDIKIRHMPLNGQGLLNGTARLAYEVGESKADGGESRFSGTSLDDMRNNVSGIDLAYRVIFADALEAGDAPLAAKVQTTIRRLASLLDIADARALEPEKIRAASEELVIALQSAAPKIGLRPPTLEDITQ